MKASEAPLPASVRALLDGLSAGDTREFRLPQELHEIDAERLAAELASRDLPPDYRAAILEANAQKLDRLSLAPIEGARILSSEESKQERRSTPAHPAEFEGARGGSWIARALATLLGSKAEADLKRLSPSVDAVNALEPAMAKLTDHALREKTKEFRALVAGAVAAVPAEKAAEAEASALRKLAVEAFAVAREAARRTTGMFHYDTQVLAGLALQEGRNVLMQTGEGKTLAAVLPAYLHALAGHGVHVVTANDYLAERDAQEMGVIFSSLGVGCSHIQATSTIGERKQAYAADITYATAPQFGFDYLKDNLVKDPADKVQRGHAFALLDESDHILIDEARTPLIISRGRSDASSAGSAETHLETQRIAARMPEALRQLEAGHRTESSDGGVEDAGDYIVDHQLRQVWLTGRGLASLEALLRVDNLYGLGQEHWAGVVQQALVAEHLMRDGDDYVVQDGKVVIVGETTGRGMAGRRWSDALHRAVEAKEGLVFSPDDSTAASITIQSYFSLYSKLAGMSGTADSEGIEKSYGLDTVEIPTHRPSKRIDHPFRLYGTRAEKLDAVVGAVVEHHERGRPVLIGTDSVEQSEHIGKALFDLGIDAQVLNASQSEEESSIVGQAGRLGAVTVATNMAGRGTDIKLGGSYKSLAKASVDEAGSEQEAEEAKLMWKARCKAEKEEVIALGGLLVLGVERHVEGRVNRQLRGRAGRQGDPGESVFFGSLEDEALRVHGRDVVRSAAERVERGGHPRGLPIQDGRILGRVEKVYRGVREHAQARRTALSELASTQAAQRTEFYRYRYQLLTGSLGEDYALTLARSEISRLVSSSRTSKPFGGRPNWDLEALSAELSKAFGLDLGLSELSQIVETSDPEEAIMGLVRHRYEARRRGLSADDSWSADRSILLEVMDAGWVELQARLDQLKDALEWRRLAGKEPEREFARDAFDMFVAFNEGAHHEALRRIFGAL